MRKNKDTEIRFEETTKELKGKSYDVGELYLGKKKIGEILVYTPKDFQVFIGEDNCGSAKSMDDALELFIRQWNLQD
ncbi:DUF2969 domain-containing protein [Enterococcus camelliae]|jgi:hypothetical protein|uniref:DUF2969 domain-containing protein n=1 Tax=Enterococcus camelliae TaxID=453959 RepID=A0ABW5TLS7_9ENTE